MPRRPPASRGSRPRWWRPPGRRGRPAPARVAATSSASSASGTIRIAGACTTRAPRRSSSAPSSSRAPGGGHRHGVAAQRQQLRRAVGRHSPSGPSGGRSCAARGHLSMVRSRCSNRVSRPRRSGQQPHPRARLPGSTAAPSTSRSARCAGVLARRSAPPPRCCQRATPPRSASPSRAIPRRHPQPRGLHPDPQRRQRVDRPVARCRSPRRRAPRAPGRRSARVEPPGGPVVAGVGARAAGLQRPQDAGDQPARRRRSASSRRRGRPCAARGRPVRRPAARPRVVLPEPAGPSTQTSRVPPSRAGGGHPRGQGRVRRPPRPAPPPTCTPALCQRGGAGWGVPADTPPRPVSAVPRRLRLITALWPAGLVVAMTVVAVLLKSSTTGVVSFHTSDQVAMVGLGLASAPGCCSSARSRVDADADGHPGAQPRSATSCPGRRCGRSASASTRRGPPCC